MGRRTAKKNEKKDKRVTVNLTEREHRDLRSRADRSDLSSLDYIRHVLFDEFNPLIEVLETEKETLRVELKKGKIQLQILEKELELERSVEGMELDERLRRQQMELERQQEFSEHLKKMLRLQKERVEVKKLEKRLLMGQLERRTSEKEAIADILSSLKE
ncbi:MAG: plasmid mobilization protein [Candidatus Thorarchaeota archaeon]|jgi:predicted DNA binding CopG/RHH family protein